MQDNIHGESARNFEQITYVHGDGATPGIDYCLKCFAHDLFLDLEASKNAAPGHELYRCRRCGSLQQP